MKFYFAGAESHLNELLQNGVTRVLVSHYSTSGPNIAKILVRFPDVFFDSGAYSAYTAKKVIDIDELIRKISSNDIKTYAGLDVIGNAINTKNNVEYMMDKGLKDVIPTFHYGEDFEFLERYCDDFNYVAIGGMVPLRKNKRVLYRFIDKCFNIISAHKHVKIHGFGVGAKWIMQRYPFYSVDATTWNVGAKFGDLCDSTTMSRRLTKKNVRDRGTLQEMVAMSNNSTTTLNIQRFLKLERYITKLWCKRGVTWD